MYGRSDAALCSRLQTLAITENCPQKCCCWNLPRLLNIHVVCRSFFHPPFFSFYFIVLATTLPCGEMKHNRWSATHCAAKVIEKREHYPSKGQKLFRKKKEGGGGESRRTERAKKKLQQPSLARIEKWSWECQWYCWSQYSFMLKTNNLVWHSWWKHGDIFFYCILNKVGTVFNWNFQMWLLMYLSWQFCL